MGGFLWSLSLASESRCCHWPLHPGYFTVAEESRKHHPTIQAALRGKSPAFQRRLSAAIGNRGCRPTPDVHALRNRLFNATWLACGERMWRASRTAPAALAGGHDGAIRGSAAPEPGVCGSRASFHHGPRCCSDFAYDENRLHTRSTTRGQNWTNGQRFDACCWGRNSSSC